MTTPDQLLSPDFGLWWTDTPAYQGHRVGTFSTPFSIGQIKTAEASLRSQGCTLAMAPLEGNTWRKHRAVIESDGSPPFLLEPMTPPETARLLAEAGYHRLAEYSSSLIDLTEPGPDLSPLEKRLAFLAIRPLAIERLEEELRAIYQLSLGAFHDNFLYTPISESEFLASYLAFSAQLTPDSALLAEHDGRLVGFVFGYPDLDRFVVKTLAVLPERTYAGLGTLLVGQIQDRAARRGLTRAIHALQREDNQSRRISKRFQATIFRRYALFARELAPKGAGPKKVMPARP